MPARRQTIGGGLVIVALAVAAFSPALRGEFVWDDDLHVRDIQKLSSLDGIRRIWFEFGATPQYYPLTFTTFWLEYHLWGLATPGFHAVNVALHAGAALVLWRLLRRLALPGAWLAAAIFAVHPVCVESVAWITERKNTLSGLLYFAAALCYLLFAGVGGPPRRAAYPAALLLFAAALLSKTMVCTLPAALAVVLWVKRGPLTSRDLVGLAPMFALAFAAALATIWVERHHVGASGGEWSLSAPGRVILAGRILWFYVLKILWPAEIIFIYPRWTIDPADPWQYVWPVAFVLLVVMLWFTRRRIGHWPLAAALIFAGTLFPVLGFFNVFYMRYSYVADHFVYHASVIIIAAVIASTELVARRMRGRHAPHIAAALLLAVLVAKSRHESRHYANLEVFWNAVLAENPRAWLASNNLGNLLIAQERHNEARPLIDSALRDNPRFPEAHLNLGQIHEGAGRHAEALAAYTRSIELDPRYAYGHELLARLLIQLQRYDEAIARLQTAIGHVPNYHKLHALLGVAHSSRGDAGAARAAFERSLELDPDDAQTLANYALSEYRAGRRSIAIAALRRTLHLEPERHKSARLLAWILATSPNDAERDGPEAVRLARQAVAAAPDQTLALDALAAAYAETGRFDDAVNIAHRAVEHAKQPALARAVAARLRLYEQRRPYRDSGASTGD